MTTKKIVIDPSAQSVGQIDQIKLNNLTFQLVYQNSQLQTIQVEGNKKDMLSDADLLRLALQIYENPKIAAPTLLDAGTFIEAHVSGLNNADVNLHTVTPGKTFYLFLYDFNHYATAGSATSAKLYFTTPDLTADLHICETEIPVNGINMHTGNTFTALKCPSQYEIHASCDIGGFATTGILGVEI